MKNQLLQKEDLPFIWVPVIGSAIGTVLAFSYNLATIGFFWG